MEGSIKRTGRGGGQVEVGVCGGGGGDVVMIRVRACFLLSTVLRKCSPLRIQPGWCVFLGVFIAVVVLLLLLGFMGFLLGFIFRFIDFFLIFFFFFWGAGGSEFFVWIFLICCCFWWGVGRLRVRKISIQISEKVKFPVPPSKL